MRVKMLEFDKLFTHDLKDDFNTLVKWMLNMKDSKDIFLKVIMILNQGNKVLSEDIVISLLVLLRKMIENSNSTNTSKEI